MRLSRVNTCLLLAVIVINGYIIATPFVPEIAFWLQNRSNSTQKLTAKLHASAATTPSTSTSNPEGNRLVIPAILLDIPFFEGVNARTLTKGVWLRPQGSVPEKGSNTVLAGHRFTYTKSQGEFYHLDKLKPGDEIGIFRNGTKYVYTVRNIKVVEPNETTIEAPTSKAQLTLYTCTPLWLPKDRLVVIATPTSPDERTHYE